MPFRHPFELTFDIRVGEAIHRVKGWESSYTLGIVKVNQEFTSVMLMPGAILATGFETLEEAHKFNVLVMEEHKPQLFTGTPSLDEFYQRAGGYEAAKLAVEKLKQKAKEKSE